MNQYQEALDRQKNNVKKLREKQFIEYKEDFDKLQELIDLYKILKNENKVLNINMDGLFKTNNFLNARINKLTHQPTLSECIKEWENKGFKTNIYQDILYIKSWKLKCEIRIWISDLTYVCSKWHKPFYYTMDMELHNLLTKTLKALEVKEDGLNSSSIK